MESAQAFWGINGQLTPSSVWISGGNIIGPEVSQTTRLTSATEAYAYAVEVDGSGYVEIALATGLVSITGGGTAQVETATAAGTITVSGNATVIVTSPLITGSPLTVPVAVTSGDTAATWAGKVRTALGAVTAITDHFTVGGSTTAVVLTALVAAINDETLNISLANGTCTGITDAPTSDNTTAGHAPANAYRVDGGSLGSDFEGKTLPDDLETYYGILAVRDDTSGAGSVISCIDGMDESLRVRMYSGEVFQQTNATGLAAINGAQTLKIESLNGYAKLLLALFCSRES